MRHWVLVKGMKQDQRHWCGVPERFAEATGGEVVCLDLPGVGTEHGRVSPWDVPSIAEDLRARWLDARTEDGPWGVLGLSLGGMIAMAWAEAHPEDFAGVAVGNTSCGATSPPTRRLDAKVWSRLVGTAMTRDVYGRERRALDLITSRRSRAELDALARRYTGYQVDRPFTPTTWVAQLVAGAKFRSPSQLEVPLLVLIGQGDRFVDPTCGEGLVQRLGADVARHPTAGHDLGVDAPVWLVETVVGWAGRL